MPDANKLHHSFIHTLHKKPLLGVLLLETDNGKIDLAINETAAKLLLEALTDFLDGPGLKSRKR